MSERVLFSVTDKSGVVEFAQGLHKRGLEIVASGGTAAAISAAGIPVISVEAITSYPSILDGRVKTLHPLIFGGILGDIHNDKHLTEMKHYDIRPFALVVCNFYDFSSALRSGDGKPETMIEKIDVGGPSMLRAAAKNHAACIPVFSSGQYDDLLSQIDRFGSLSAIPDDLRLRYSALAFRYSADYEAAISEFFETFLTPEDGLPDRLNLRLVKATDMRYGENPFQKAALYRRGGETTWEQLHGKELSYNNYADIQSAREIVLTYDEPAVSIIKHSNPCGFGLADSADNAYLKAVTTDPVSYYGGIVGFNREVDDRCAGELAKSFLECIIAPSYSAGALEILQKKKNLRLLRYADSEIRPGLEYKALDVGILVQERDTGMGSESGLECVTAIRPDESDLPALRIGWDLVRHVKSNAIVFASADRLLGVGAGQMSRVDSVKIAIRKSKEAGLDLKGSILASDAFFPFPDVVDLIRELGVRGIIQPGGSIRDQEVIDACNEHKLFMLFTHHRHFRH